LQRAANVPAILVLLNGLYDSKLIILAMEDIEINIMIIIILLLVYCVTFNWLFSLDNTQGVDYRNFVVYLRSFEWAFTKNISNSNNVIFTHHNGYAGGVKQIVINEVIEFAREKSMSFDAQVLSKHK